MQKVKYMQKRFEESGLALKNRGVIKMHLTVSYEY